MYFALNSIFVDFIDKKTMFNPKGRDNLQFDMKYRWLFILVGIPCLLFTKRIKKWRKIHYFKSRLKNIDNMKKWSFVGDNFCSDEIKKIDRYLKLQKLKNG